MDSLALVSLAATPLTLSVDWAFAAACHPLPCQVDELLMRERGQRTRRPARGAARTPSPSHEPGVEVSDELVRSHPAARRVEDHTAELPGRKSLPGHSERGQMPVRRARHSRGGLIVVLVTRLALKSRCAMIRGAPSDVHGVAMAVVALPREVAARVTVQATRMQQYWDHAFKERRRSGARAARYIRRASRHHAEGQRHTYEGQRGHPHGGQDFRFHAASL